MAKKWEWFRMYSEAADDPKLEYLQDNEFRTWFKLLCLASKKEEEEDRGIIKLAGKNPFLKLAIQVSKADIELLKSTLEKLETVEIIEVTEEEIKFINFTSRQYNKSSDAAEATRKRKQKSRLKKEESRNVTQCHTTSRNVTPHTNTNTNTNTNIDISTSTGNAHTENTQNSKIENTTKNEELQTSNSSLAVKSSNKIQKAAKKQQREFLEEIRNSYNLRCISLPDCTKISNKRESSLNSRINEDKENRNKIQFWNDYFSQIELSDFLTGRKTEWQASFDWIINSGNMIKILEGNFKNKKPSNGKSNTKKGESEYYDPYWQDLKPAERMFDHLEEVKEI